MARSPPRTEEANDGRRRRDRPLGTAERHPDLRFRAVDLPAEPALAAAVGVQRAPSLMVFRDGVPVFAEPGWLPEDSIELLIATIRQLDMAAVRETFPPPVRRG